MNTPKTSRLIAAIEDREGEPVDCHTAPEEWVNLARELERENARLREALDDQQEKAKRLYNAACFHWQTMPEDAKRRFRELVVESCDEMLSALPNAVHEPQARQKTSDEISP